MLSEALVTSLGTYFLAYVANHLVHGLRIDVFNRYLLLPFKFFDQTMVWTFGVGGYL